jgi:hypothetical protein
VIPAPVSVLLDTRLNADDRAGSRRILRGMMRDLRDQAVAASEQYETDPTKHDPTQFTVYPESGLDLFSHEGACERLRCRLGYVDRFARSLGLLADRIVLSDTFTTQILRMGRATNVALDRLLDDVLVLQRLRPLIDAGIVVFEVPLYLLCEDCGKEFLRRADTAADEIFLHFKDRISIAESAVADFALDLGDLYDPPLLFPVARKEIEPDPSVASRALIARAVRQSWITAGRAAHGHGTVFSNSKLSIVSLVHQEGLDRDAEVDRWDASRIAHLPWVSQLSIDEVLILRQEAARALPRFRELLRRYYGARDVGAGGNPVNDEALLQQLREDVVEVEAELRNVGNRSSRHFQTGFGLLAIAVAAFGGVEGKALEGLVGLLATLGLLHQFSREDQKHGEALTTRPGYVLVQARELLAHADA